MDPEINSRRTHPAVDPAAVDNATRQQQNVGVSDDPGMPQALTYWGIGVGLALAAAGTVLVFFSAEVPQPLGALTMCVGFGIVLAAFGSRAGGSWGGFAVVGAGALAVVLFLLVQRYIPPFQKHWQVRTDLAKIASLDIIDDEPLYNRRDLNTGAIRFIVLDRRFKSSTLVANVDTTDKGPGESFKMLAASNDLKQYLSEDATWVLDYQHHAIKDGAKTLFAVRDVLDENDLANGAPPPNAGWFAWLLSFIRDAWADGAPDAEPFVKDLSNDDVAKRKNAREGLIVLGAAAVAPMMAAWQRAPDDYRLKYGVTSTLAAVLRSDPNSRAQISAALNADDFALLVRTTGDEDPSIRYQATDFLYNLKDPRSVAPAIDQINSAKPSYNSVLILKNVYQSLPQAEQHSVSTQLNATRAERDERSRTLIESFTAK